MKKLNILTLLSVTAAVLTVLPGIASAAKLTSPTGDTDPFTGVIQASGEGHTIIDNKIALISCATTFEGKVEDHEEITGNIDGLAFTGCTNSWHVTVTSKGTWGIDWTSGYKGDLYADGTTIEATRFGVTCRYVTKFTSLGTFTGGSPATVDLEANLPLENGSFLCGEGPDSWTGNFKVTDPTSLYADG